MFRQRFETEYAPIGTSGQTPASDETATIDPPPAARSIGEAGNRVPVGRHDVHLEDGIPVGVRRLRQRRFVENARVQDERVETTEARDRLVHRAGDVGGGARVGLGEGRAGLGRHGGAPRLVPTGEDHSGALGAKPADDCRSDARGSARHQGTNVVQAPHRTAIIPPADAPCNPAAEPQYISGLRRKGGRMEAGNAASGPRPGLAGDTELARNALGLPAILFCIVTGSAPLAAMMFNDPLSGYGMGISVPAGFWIATVAFTLFSVAYIEMARRVTTAGGIYSYMSYGFGRDRRPWRGSRDRRRVHPVRGRRERRHVLLRTDEHPGSLRAASTWTGASMPTASSR